MLRFCCSSSIASIRRHVSSLPSSREQTPESILHQRSKWVVFSDLHVSDASLATSLRVLETVHDIAEKKGAGVIFLGDFWHARGNIPIQSLNQVMSCFRGWSCPTLMIPGNHDQLSLDGSVHSLSILQYAPASASVLVMSNPTCAARALWLPYRKNLEVLKHEIGKAAANVDAIFCHMDIKGANITSKIKCNFGFDPNGFPTKMKVYSGHYHEPQIVPNTLSLVHYVGSPYQVSINEANQDKRVLLLDKDDGWSIVESIGIEVGPRHHVLTSLQEAKGIKPGDRVKVHVNSSSEAHDQLSQVEMMRKQGIDVRISVAPKAPQKPRIPHLESMQPQGVWDEYSKHVTLSPQAVSLGADILSEQPQVSSGVAGIQHQHLEIHSVVLNNYCCFKGAMKHDVKDRGLVWIRGQCYNSTSESNGAGKTSLITAILWCLTGSKSGRGQMIDIVNDNEGFGSVTILGLLNGEPFSVERVRKKRGTIKQSLKITINNKDISEQTLPLTQVKLNTLVDPQALQWLFFTEATPKLLSLTDGELKSELASLLNIQLWQNAAKTAREMKTEIEAEVQNRKGNVKALEKQWCTQQHHHRQMEQLKNTWDETHATTVVAQLHDIRKRIGEVKKTLLEEIPDVAEVENDSVEAIKMWISTQREAISTKLSELEAKIESGTTQKKEEAMLKVLEGQLSKLQGEANDALKRYEAALQSRASLNCPTCGQGIPESTGDSMKEQALEKLTQANAKTAKLQEELKQLSHKNNDNNNNNEQKEELSMADVAKKSRNLTNISLMLRDVQCSIGTYERMTMDKENPHVKATQMAKEMLEDLEREQVKLKQEIVQLDLKCSYLKEVMDAMGLKGVQSFLTDQILANLQHESLGFLDILSDGEMELHLLSNPENDRIDKSVTIRTRGEKEIERSIQQLSGGQYRRVNLAMSLALGKILAKRAAFDCNVIVFDEIVQQLDTVGRRSMAQLLKMLTQGNMTTMEKSYGTVLIALQDVDAQSLHIEFDHVDTVERQGSRATIKQKYEKEG